MKMKLTADAIANSADEIAHHQDPAPSATVDPRARRQPDQSERDRARGRHRAELERCCTQIQHSQQRYRHTTDLSPELTGRLPDQQPPEIPAHTNLHSTGWEPHPPAEIRR
jgi:hypothetical protein